MTRLAWLARELGVPEHVAVVAAGEAALLKAGGCAFCSARRIRVLLASSTVPRMRRVSRELDRLWLYGERCPDCAQELAA